MTEKELGLVEIMSGVWQVRSPNPKPDYDYFRPYSPAQTAHEMWRDQELLMMAKRQQVKEIAIQEEGMFCIF